MRQASVILAEMLDNKHVKEHAHRCRAIHTYLRGGEYPQTESLVEASCGFYWPLTLRRRLARALELRLANPWASRLPSAAATCVIIEQVYEQLPEKWK